MATLQPSASLAVGKVGKGLPHVRSAPILRESVLAKSGASEAREWSTIDFVQDRELESRSAMTPGQRRPTGAAAPVTGGAPPPGGAGIEPGVSEGAPLADGADTWISVSSGWLAAVLAGMFMGLCAVLVEVCTKFVTSIRVGLCVNYFWLNHELCCPDSEGKACPNFVTWGEYFGGETSHHRVVTNFVMYLFWGVVFAATASYFCRTYAPYGAGGGINEVKTVVSGQVMKRYFSGWTMFVKSIGVCMSTGSGMVVGKEGPFVHLGSCSADIVGSLFPAYQLGSRRRELISAGAGGGLAVAFGAPIGGVVFAIEEISSFFSFRAMMQALMHGVAAVLMVKNFDVMHTGRIVQFSIDYTHRWHWFELPLFALVGAFGGLVGALYNVCNIAIIKNRRSTSIKDWPITEVVVIVLISNTVNFILPLCKGGHLDLLSELFQDCQPGSEALLCQENELTLMLFLIIAGIVKATLSVFSVGSTVPCGLLVPSLVIGGLFGRAFGIFFKALQTSYSGSYFFSSCSGLHLCIIPGAYAIVGSAAVLTGVTRMTVSLAVIMFELTGGIEYLVPVIVAILVSKWVGEAVGVDSIYELGVEITALPYLDPKKEFHHAANVTEVAGPREYRMLTERGWDLDRLNELLEKTNFTGYPLVVSDTDFTLYGYVSRKALIGAMHEAAMRHDIVADGSTPVLFSDPRPDDDPTSLNFSSAVDQGVLQVPPDCSVQRLLYLFKSLGSRMFIVTKFSRFVAIVTKKDLIEYMRKVEHAAEHEDEELLHSKEH